MSDKVQQGLVTIQKQSGDFELSTSARLHKIDGLYQETISHIKPRIMVQGEQVHLANPDTTSRIRSLLFAGIRAAVLWRQRGGSRWKLLFGRKKLVNQAEYFLQRFQPSMSGH
jgi:high frequency lysogenization protein